MNPSPQRPKAPASRRSFRPRIGYLILATLAFPVVFGCGALLLIIFLGPHPTDGSSPPSQPSIQVSQSTTPPDLPTRHPCYPFQPEC
ncbi:hypothetical protein ACIRRA_45280 [Nocardia sp. NPDC101769]|uniref:hypothetical protein n=1 Tax=Nocardia sp. NPDC101769 TaxID=3364333 RepID=UPI0038086CEB